MKIGFYNDFQPCVVKDDGVVDISDAVGHLSISSPQRYMERIIVNFDELRSSLEAAESSGTVIPMAHGPSAAAFAGAAAGQGPVRQRQLYGERTRLTPTRPLKTFFKSPDAVIGPGDTVDLPAFRPVIFNP